MGEMHDVVNLLLKRMESHPEEFESALGESENLTDAQDRWWRVLDRVLEHGTEEEKAAIRAALREIKLDAAHRIMMDELLNGDERRRRMQEEETTYERNLLLRQSLAAQQVVQQQMTTALDNSQLRTLIDNYNPKPWEPINHGNGGLVATVKKGLGIK